MNVVAKIESAAFERRLNKVIQKMPYLALSALNKTALKGKQTILARTAKGIGYQGKFAGYSTTPNGGYALRKRIGWKGFSGDSSGIVNLYLTGDMLKAMQTKASPTEGLIYFSNPQSAKKALFNNRKRPFFGFNNQEKTKLVRFFTKQIKL